MAERVTKIEGAVLLAPCECRAVFKLETGCLHRLQHAGFFDEIEAMGQQAFANRKAREVLALNDQHIVAVTFEQGRGDGARRPGTNDDNLTALQFYS